MHLLRPAFACLGPMIACLGAALALVPMHSAAAPRDEAWKDVETHFERARPQSALEALAAIETAAAGEEAWAELAKAVAYHVVAETQIQGGHPEEKVRRYGTALADAPEEIRPVLQTLLASAYWEYFQHNRWRLLERTRTAEAPGEDFETWDLPRLLAEIDARYQASLEHAQVLRQIPVAEFDALLVKGNIPDRYRPTLYDFLAHEALGFYKAAEQAGSVAQGAFVFDADSPALGTMEDFLAWQPEAADESSPQLRAIALYQELLRFHAEEPGARALVDLGRIEWAAEEAVGEQAGERARERLAELLERCGEDEAGVAVAGRLAQRLHAAEELVEARRIALEAAERHPDSVFAAACRDLVKRVEARALRIGTERVWNAAGPEIEITYRNVTEVHFRLVPQRWELSGRRSGRPGTPEQDEILAALETAPAAAWTVALPETEDYRTQVLRVDAPADQEPGFYLLIASGDAAFSTEENRLAAEVVWVSPLALVVRNSPDGAEGFVLEAESGEPLEGAEVEVWSADDNARWTLAAARRTDAMGFFRHETEEGEFVFLAKHEGAAVSSGSRRFWGARGDDPFAPRDERGNARFEHFRNFLFTDRALYRPGQTIRFKGIHALLDTERNDYRALPKTRVTLRLRDTNWDEVEELQVDTNDRGGFSGAFTAPQGRLTGRMFIEIHGTTVASVAVEEYKRPRFHVALDAPEDSPQLGEEITITGRAESYAGAPVDGAEVSWRVVREARFPGWLRWSGWFPPVIDGARQEIANGMAASAADGSFEVRFSAVPDLRIEERAEPSFVFSVYVDVTDGAGETRTGERRFTIGYTSMKAELSAAEWQTAAEPVAISVSTSSLDGEPLAASGTVTVHRLEGTEQVTRPPLECYYRLAGWETQEIPDLSDPSDWPLGEVVQRDEFTTDENGKTSVEVKLAPGEYRAVLASRDRAGREVAALLQVRVVDPDSETFPVRISHHLSAKSWTLEPGESLEALWGTGYDEGRAFVEVEHRGRIVQRYWTEPGRTQQRIAVPVTETERGGFTLHVTQIRENRAHLMRQLVAVPWTNKEYSIRWERMRDRLEPGAKETWTLVVEGVDGDEIPEMVAAMYDASLDAFLPHSWRKRLEGFYWDRSSRTSVFQNDRIRNLSSISNYTFSQSAETLRWRTFPRVLETQQRPAFGVFPRDTAGGELTFVRSGGPSMNFAPITMAAEPAALDAEASTADLRGIPLDSAPDAPPIDWSEVSTRQNLEETAFFFPHLLADETGTIRLEFTMPEALTTWKFLGFAHDRELRSGLLTGEAVSSKDLMVQPNPPRFLREGDTVEFTVTVTNWADQPAEGKVRLEFSDAASLDSADAALGNATPEQEIDIPAKESRSYAWRIAVPDGQGFLQYRAVASTGTVSDGEQGWLPVLSRRILLTESITLPIRDAGEKTFTLPKLLESGASETLQHQSLTAQVVSQPAWYAVLSLPYLMEFPHECAEQVFNRLYANALARHMAESDPRIRRVFDLWREAQPEALDSPLLKNEELKSVLIEETPWLRDAKDETQARRKVGLLFEANRLDHEAAAALRQLESMQIDTGAWPWFPGGRENEFVTLYLVAGFARLGHLGVAIDERLALRALDRLDNWIAERHQACLRDQVERFGSIEALYLYARSFYLERRPVAEEHQAAIEYFKGLAEKLWPRLPRQSQAHVALGLQRFGEAEKPAEILASLLERSVHDEELGRYWRDTEQHWWWWWYSAPIETQAMMIEAFREIAEDQATADECRVWLLKQRQTQAWPSTKSTADAVYALLLGGDDLLGSDALVSLSLGGDEVKPEGVEAGTGFYEKRFAASEVRPEMGNITLTKTDPGVSWGSLHWQYLEDLSAVTPHEDNPLTLKKSLFLKVHGPAGPELKPLAAGDKLAPGDELVTRVELRSDRDLEYVHLKDQRGSGTEPVNVLSRWRFQDGLAYYESTRDAASHFFIEYLPKGTYVFETSVRVQLRGVYQSGVAEIQCLYAPEFSSHSGSVALRVE